MFKLEFTTSNAAFADDLAPYECAGILTAVASKLKNGETEGTLRDTNGNKVGFWYLDVLDNDDDC